MPPVDAGDEGPPSRRIVERDQAIGFLEQQRSGLDAVQVGARIQLGIGRQFRKRPIARRSEEHTSELQSLMRISYAVFCLKKKNKKPHNNTSHKTTEDQ